MDSQHFDRLTRQFGQALSRRRFGAVLTALGLGTGLGAAPKIKAKLKKKKKKKKPKPCARGTARCGSACVDTRTNAAHCGGCGQSCGAGVACIDGECQAGGCTGNQILCSGQCVNPNNDEAHCGQCNRACGGDLTCIGGECGCAAGTRCGTECVNTQTDRDHCGGCDDACDAGVECVGGECDASTPECTFDADCRAVGIGPTCQNGRCACTKPGEGVCLLASGARACSVCCPGGSGACVGDFVCRHDSEFSWPTCFCPGDSEMCTFGRCSRDFDTDERRCGLDCVDCTDDPGGACCWARRCVRGCGIGEFCSERLGPCGGGCEPCPEGQICCNEGPDTPTQCLLDIAGGFCYSI